MKSEAADKQLHLGVPEITGRVDRLSINQDRGPKSLPSPPSSVESTALGSDRDVNSSLSSTDATSDLPESGTPVHAHGGASTDDEVHDEHSSRTPSTNPKEVEKDLQDNSNTYPKEQYTTFKGPNSEDDENEDLRFSVIVDQVPMATLKPLPLQERIRKGANFAVRQMEHVRLMEDRMRDMEKRLQSIERKEAESEPPAPALGMVNQPVDTILGIRRMTFKEYQPTDPNPEDRLSDGSAAIQHQRRHEFPDQLPYHLIDVVISGMKQPKRASRSQNKQPKPGSLHTATPSSAIPGHDLEATDLSSMQPERIRINSTLLLRVLEKITGTGFSLAKMNNKFVLNEQVILRPFKVFVSFEQEIRNEIDRLEKIHMRNDSESHSRTPEIVDNEGRIQRASASTDQDVSLDTDGISRRERSDSLTSGNFQYVASDASADGKHDDLSPLESRRCLEELLILRELLDNDLKPTFDLRRQIKDGSARDIAFQDLWHLFPLGSEIVCNDFNGQNQAYRILDASGGRPFLSNRSEAHMSPVELTPSGRDVPKFDILSCFYGFDGKELGACQQLHTIKSYDGNRTVMSLPCFPIQYCKQSRALKSRDFFIGRGKRFLELTRNSKVVHKRYDGLTMAMDEFREEIDSEVIIDVSMAMLKNNVIVDFGVTGRLEPDRRETLEFLDHRCKLEGCCQNTPIHRDYRIDEARNTKLLETKDFIRASIESDSELTDEELLVCPCWVYGYVLRNRKWVKLDVSLVEHIEESGSGFDSLVLPDGHKEELLALVNNHSQGKKREAGLKAEKRQLDLVRGKGKGLIILLHGEPGVGKSSTAESVAAFTRRPLFQVTCGDIGESADEVERRLENHFQLAHKWGCVLLLDEADVFLEARSKTDLKRNAIVSVFLRVLEYYSGILFLTTNRVGAFDQAFRSRIHMSLYYPRIKEPSTLKIWEMNIERAREMWGDKLLFNEADRKGILDFASKHYKDLEASGTTWNGRQIRNAFQSALALAEWDANQTQQKYNLEHMPRPRLEAEHFQRVAKASEHFDKYLAETHAGTMADLARDNRERTDDFAGPES